jgi:hypothetical protein
VLRDLAKRTHDTLDGRFDGPNLHVVKRVLLEDSLIVEVRDSAVTPFLDVGARLPNVA